MKNPKSLIMQVKTADGFLANYGIIPFPPLPIYRFYCQPNLTVNSFKDDSLPDTLTLRVREYELRKYDNRVALYYEKENN